MESELHGLGAPEERPARLLDIVPNLSDVGQRCHQFLVQLSRPVGYGKQHVDLSPLFLGLGSVDVGKVEGGHGGG